VRMLGRIKARLQASKRREADSADGEGYSASQGASMPPSFH
jgi:hypothetical protein